MSFMSANAMRKEIAKLYKGDKWQERVAKMPDKQVLAIYQKYLGVNSNARNTLKSV